MNMKTQLSVRLHGQHIGILAQNEAGKMVFTYDKSATTAISLHLPIQEAPYATDCEAYFGGLLPESESVRKAIGKYYNISPNNNFALLKTIGHDCAGAISFHEMDEPIIPQTSVPLEGSIVSDDTLYQHIIALPQKPFFQGWKDLKLILAGVQDKAAVCIIDNQIAIPSHGCPTTHILKPANPRFEGIVENEVFCLKLASRIGLSVPAVNIHYIKDITFLLIQRYDRHIEGNFAKRIHQEDFCQALGVISSKKYQNEGGPSFKDCFNILNKVTKPAIDRNRLVSGIIFNLIIGNMDAHSKNFSLLHRNHASISLAPFYDLVCTRVYEFLSSKMAMKIRGRYESDNILPRHWEQFCQDIDYSYPALILQIQKISELIQKEAEEQRNHIIKTKTHVPIIDTMMRLFENNIHRIRKLFAF